MRLQLRFRASRRAGALQAKKTRSAAVNTQKPTAAVSNESLVQAKTTERARCRPKKLAVQQSALKAPPTV